MYNNQTDVFRDWLLYIKTSCWFFYIELLTSPPLTSIIVMLLNCITMRARVCCSNVWLYTPHNILFTLCEIWFGPCSCHSFTPFRPFLTVQDSSIGDQTDYNDYSSHIYDSRLTLLKRTQVFLVLLFKIHVAPRKNVIRWKFFWEIITSTTILKVHKKK